MNIVILGGGTPGKFGNTFALRARAEGHKVIIFSHVLNGTNDPDQYVINYNDLDFSRFIISNVLNTLNKIDILIFNQNGRSYPSITPDYDFNLDTNIMHDSFNTHAVMPHLLLSLCHPKLQDGSKVIQMSTFIAFMPVRDGVHEHYTYSGFKSFMSHTMMGYAHNRKNKITYSVICPKFEKDQFDYIVDKVYNHILTHDDSWNGTVASIWDKNPIDKLSWVTKR